MLNKKALRQVYNDALVTCQARPDMYVSDARDKAIAAVALRVLEEVKRRIERRELKDQTLLASAIYTELDYLADEIGGADGEG